MILSLIVLTVVHSLRGYIHFVVSSKLFIVIFLYLIGFFDFVMQPVPWSLSRHWM